MRMLFLLHIFSNNSKQNNLNIQKDNIFDCSDNSDELNCTCESNSFKCNSGQCINKKYHCDGSPHCRDGSDETNCNECFEFKCSNDKCIPSE